ncbi:MAG: mechanosensitive ion channel family protein [Cupriavidus sp.]|nr:MAG: mechanosensitive ion channel family protein [Cupriavidus sp.]
MTIKQRIANLMQEPDQLFDLAAPYVLHVLAAILIFFVGKWLANWAVRLVRAAMRRASVDETLGDFLGNVLYGLALTVVVVSSMHQLGIDTTSAAAVLGGAALAIGLSLQQQLSSLAAGVILIIFRPFKKGDTVEIGSGIKGVVEEIKIVHTRLRSFDNREVMVPNSSITTNTIINYTARNMRRIDLVISINYSADLLKAKQILRELQDADKRILKNPASSVGVAALSPSSLDLSVLSWVKTPDYDAVKGDLLEAIKLRFERDGIGLTGTGTPAMNVTVKQST